MIIISTILIFLPHSIFQGRQIAHKLLNQSAKILWVFKDLLYCKIVNTKCNSLTL